MEKKEKTSPIPGSNLYDPATLLGASPFSPAMAAALPFAHLAHLPGAFSMLGHPAFPMSSLFGHLGDGLTSPLGLPASLASSLGATSAPPTSTLSFDSLLSPILLSMGQGGPVSDPFSLIGPPPPTSNKMDTSKYGSLFSQPCTSATSTTTCSKSRTTLSSSPSPPSTLSSPTSGSGRQHGGHSYARAPHSSHGPLSPGSMPRLGSPGSLRTPRGRGGRGQGRSRGRGSGGGRGSRQRRSPRADIPLSLVQSSSILSPSMLERYAKQHMETNGLDADRSPENKSRMSSLFDIDFYQKDRPRQKSPTKSQHSPSGPSRTSTSASNGNHGDDEEATHSEGDVHIDSFKKKLIADQIRNRMESKSSSSSTSISSPSSTPLPSSSALFSPSPMSFLTSSGEPTPSQSLLAAAAFLNMSMGQPSRKRRGRPPKISTDDTCNLTPKELEEEARIQARIKRELELEMKQKEIALKLITEGGLDGHHGNRSRGKGRRSSESPSKRGVDGAGACGTSSGDSSRPVNGKASTESEDDKPPMHKDGRDESQESDLEEGERSVKFKDMGLDLSGNVSSAAESNDLDMLSGASGSEMDNYTEDSDFDTGDDSSGGKHKIEYNESGRPIKRRHVVLDDSKIRIPLEKGWKRQTNIHSYGRRGIVGEVWYFAPCGRKIKTIPDVMRYIERNNVTNLNRGHFSFNTKVNVGDFYEARVAGGENGFVKLSDSEIQDRLSVTVSRRLKKIENQKKREKLKIQQLMARQMIENKMKQKLEQQEMARKVAEMQFQKRVQREQQKELLKRAKQLKILEKRKQRELERQQREEQLRLRQEMRAKQLVEKRQRKQVESQKKKYLKSLKQAEEREMKRQQVAMLKEQMRVRQDQERRRQHMILLKALEQRKKQEEREKQKEEKIAERRMHKERKEMERKMEFVLAQELKKPREDMELRDSKALPEIPRIPGNHLDGEALADCLMSLEFLHNFANPLGFDSDSLPTLRSLQDAVTCKTEEDGEEYLSLVTHLLRYALDDPGVPNPKEAVTKLGQKITDLELTDVILGEVLRIFMLVRNGGETSLSEYLRNYPLEACSINQRAAIVAFLCNELNCSRMITTEIESHLDSMADIRRDKWVIEGKLRRLRTLRNKKFKPLSMTPKPTPGSDADLTGGDDSAMAACGEDSVMTAISKQSDEDDSGNEEDGPGFNETETEEDDPTNLEECEKQIEKLQKQHAQHRDKVFEKSQRVRAIDLGQDRYKRNYWILPHVGGIFLEGMESGKIKDIVLPKVKSERSRSDSRSNLKVEVIGEKTEKKAVEFLEDIPEKKASEILKLKEEKVDSKECEENKEVKCEEEKDVKKVLDEINEKQKLNGVVKFELDIDTPKLEKENSVKIENDGSVKKEMDENMMQVNGEVGEIKFEYSKEGIKCEETGVDTSKVCNGDIGQLNDASKDHVDQKPPQENANVSGSPDEPLKSPTKHVELKIPTVKSSAIDKDPRSDTQSNASLLLQVANSTKLSDFCSMSIDAAMKTDPSVKDRHDHHQSTSSSSSSTLTSSLFANTSFIDHMTKPSTNHKPSLSSPPQPPPAHSKTPVSERKPSFMSIDSILDKTKASSHSTSFPYQSSALPVNPFVSQPVSDSITASSDSRPWFSLLPRVPCDDMSLTRGQHSSGLLLSPPFMSQLPFHPFSIQNPAFSSFQMEQLFSGLTSVASTSSLMSLSTSSSMSHMNTTAEESFKKPEPVNSSQTPKPEDVLKTYQGEAKPIPEEYQRGWWRVSDRKQVTELQSCLHSRGLRERSLQKTVQRFQDYAEASCDKGKDDVLCMESSSEEEVTDDEEENTGADDKADAAGECADAKQTDKQEVNKDNSESTNSENGEKSNNVSNSGSDKVDSDLGNDKNSESRTNESVSVNDVETQAEGKGEKNSSENGCESKMEVDDKSDTKSNTDSMGKSSEENSANEDKTDKDSGSENNETEQKTGGRRSKKKRGKKASKVVRKKYKKVKKPAPTINCKSRSDEGDRLILEEVETFEDRIAVASLQIKGWKLAPKTFSEESEIRIIPRGEQKRDDNDCYPLEAAKERLLQLELNIERRYLKPPLAKAQRISLNSMSSGQPQQQAAAQDYDDNDSDVDFESLPVGLQMWRIAVATATSPAQLMLCIIQLNKAISWEKSIMKVLCQICRKDDNEAELLLCDGCDRGYHTYCFKPKMETVPDGDWYCFECVAKVVGESCCLVCGRRLGKMAECNTCNRCVHIDCLEPPLPRVPRKWLCASCDDMKGSSAKKRVRKNSTTSTTSTVSVAPATPAAPVAVVTPVPPSTPTPDLTPSGRKRRSDFGVPRKRKSSESTSDGDGTPQKRQHVDGSAGGSDGGKKSSGANVVTVDGSVSGTTDELSEESFKLQEQSSDMKICRSILLEMMKHEDGWPFLQPVNCKHFPSYRKYIKQPMDFGTMKVKLRDHVYRLRSEFVADAILVFDNCQLFNEDDSEVGQCGHKMRDFFKRRWREIIFEAMTENV